MSESVVPVEIGEVVLGIPVGWSAPTYDEVGQCCTVASPVGDPTLIVRTARWRGAEVKGREEGILQGLGDAHYEFLLAMGFVAEGVGYDGFREAGGISLLSQVGFGEWHSIEGVSPYMFYTFHALYPGRELLTLHVGTTAPERDRDLGRLGSITLGFLTQVKGFRTEAR